jgi:hypothetical protein
MKYRNEDDSKSPREGNGSIHPKMLLAIAVTASVLLLSVAFSAQLPLKGAIASDKTEPNGATKLFQPNDSSTIVHAKATNALY